MVLHVGDQDLVPRAYPGPQETLGDEVDRFGGSPGKNQFPLRAGIDEPGQAAARCLIEISRLLA